MSKFLKNIMYKDKCSKSDEITNYLIEEIEDIVSKKVGDYKFKDQEYIDKSYNREYKSNEKNSHITNKIYSSHINYNLKQEQPFKASRYISENHQISDFLPFEEEDIRPKFSNVEQIKSMVRKTLRPALNQWLDENLDIIIEKAIKRSYNKPLSNSRKRFHYYNEE